jgi:hypothetical protein
MNPRRPLAVGLIQGLGPWLKKAWKHRRVEVCESWEKKKYV